MTKEEFIALDSEKVLLVDIRESSELVDVPLLEGSVNIPMGEIIRGAEDNELSKDKKIVTICRSGARCQVVNAVLLGRGYDVDYLEGGMNAL